MDILFIILGGAAGGFLGWLISRKASRGKVAVEAKQADTCETGT
jgi:hypothetical protein